MEKTKVPAIDEAVSVEQLAETAYPNLDRIGDKNCGLSYNDLRGIQRSAYTYGYTAALSAKQPEKEVDNIEQVAVKGIEFLENQSGMPKDFFENVKVVPFHCAMDVINLMREEYANTAANHIKSTHVPIEEVIAKLDKLFIELLGVGDTDSAQCISNMIYQIRSLIKSQ